MLEAIARIQNYVDGFTFESFAADERTVDAVVRNFQILGEAAGRIPEAIKSGFPDVPWDDIKAMRNFVIHVYFDVDLEVVWRTIVNDLPPLIEPLKRLLADSDPAGTGHPHDAA